MRHPATAALLVALAVLAPVLAPALLAVAPAGAASAPLDSAAAAAVDTPTGDTVTVTGRVTHENGSAATDASVLAGSCAFLEKATPSRLREVAAGDSGDVHAVDVDDEGYYSIEVAPDECLVAIAPDGVSRVARVDDGGSRDHTLYASKPLQFGTTTGVAEPGGRAVVHVELKNSGDEPVENLRLKIDALPQGWNLVAVRTEGATFHQGNRTLVWSTLEPGEWAEADIRVFVAVDAETGSHELPLFADSDTTPVTADNMTFEVRYPTTRPSKTPTGLPAEGIGDTGVGAPGLGPVVAVVALLAAGLLAARDT